MTYPAYDLMRMKLNKPDIYKNYEHPWYKFNKDQSKKTELLKKPNPPTQLQIEKAKFVDKTYVWKHHRI